MTFQRQDNLKAMKEWMVRLEAAIRVDGSLRHQDSLIELENFFRDILNFVFEWRLENANLLFGKNNDSFDLSDSEKRVAVQVTVTTTPAKIRNTLNTFIGKHDSSYDRLLFIYPVIECPKSQADFSNDLKGFDFEPSRDRLGLSSILEKAQDMDVRRQGEFLKLIARELHPLGASLRLGVDKTMETLIEAIRFMSENAPLGSVQIDEQSPDIKQKRTRLAQHAEYLLGELRTHQVLHATIEQARSAIGYDTVRATKIQAWLKSRSNDALQACGGDASLAFQTLSLTLLQAAHSHGTDAEATAVRFLLADEFVRCNVFPNPTG